VAASSKRTGLQYSTSASIAVRDATGWPDYRKLVYFNLSDDKRYLPFTSIGTATATTLRMVAIERM
jgi:hypothetical protein